MYVLALLLTIGWVFTFGWKLMSLLIWNVIERICFRRKVSNNIGDPEFALASVESAAVDDRVSRAGMRISNIVEVGEVEFRAHEARDPSLPGCSHNVVSREMSRERKKISNLVLTKKSLTDNSPVLPRKRVSLEDDPGFVGVLDKIFEKAGPCKSSCDSRAAPVILVSCR